MWLFIDGWRTGPTVTVSLWSDRRGKCVVLAPALPIGKCEIQNDPGAELLGRLMWNLNYYISPRRRGFF